MTKTILFDFDGTLADTLPLCIHAFQPVFKTYEGKNYSEEDIVAMFGPSEREIIRENVGNRNKEAAIDHYYDIYDREHEDFVPKNREVIEMLHYLKNSGMNLGIITGKARRSLDLSLEKLNMNDIFDVTIAGDEVEEPKPFPESVEKALDFLGASTEETLFLGDSGADIGAGKAAGVSTALVSWLPEYTGASSKVEPTYKFESLIGFLHDPIIQSEKSLEWFHWTKKIQAVSQSGLAYSKNVHDIERYEELRDITASMMEGLTDFDKFAIRDLFKGEIGYATPKVDVRAVIFQEEKLLLVKEKSDGRWSLPGGWADAGLTPAEVAVKETWEESGYETEASGLLGVLNYGSHPHPPFPFEVYKIFVACDITGGQPARSIETSDVGFFGETELPELSTNRNTSGQIRMLFENRNNVDQSVFFD
ncbi:NUDIX hydrolase N-terminal domain-containing protein [Salimicrobium halophilum]|uniref:Haloacid dehalogenase superfamily, subfamily IA, variant 3 with third motif having DD or ED/haloacid dehalogenase superfamily, subfamily IA, variant 1 with third motif having Dx(3-4)D or Dx(3-4)E n=1 Tax=Salimicrobium halophilum TaxID=86666 RepID=A0A1G8R0H0_9BACI|nr:NUDIX hydrolase N-terminal domain-containing protein [Salimicrobium halophilum]SDJ10353.1 haloacid dehalogenase superfamily, subfamily IA, variant 3 with third motif having DD or ED/haloacid dehalogenase superfamily, subfamily IA, variant 1 with third motif having Dx(3-4)D or Dx(3-4)E [Salimicrobium halophilum]